MLFLVSDGILERIFLEVIGRLVGDYSRPKGQPRWPKHHSIVT